MEMKNFGLSDIKNGFKVQLEKGTEKYKVICSSLVRLDLNDIIEDYQDVFNDTLECIYCDYNNIEFVWDCNDNLVYDRTELNQEKKMLDLLAEYHINNSQQLQAILDNNNDDNNEEYNLYKTHCEEFGNVDIFTKLGENGINNITDLDIIIAESIDLRERVEELEDELDKCQDFDDIEEQRDDYQRALNKINDILQCTDF